jgi:hypothetical protein
VGWLVLAYVRSSCVISYNTLYYIFHAMPALSEGGSQPSDMRAVTVRVLTHSQCIKRYSGTANKIGTGMLCAGADKGEDSCQGNLSLLFIIRIAIFMTFL